MPTRLHAMETADDLCDYLGLGQPEREYLVKHIKHRYRSIQVPKRRGGFRSLSIPDNRLKFIQRKILILLEEVFIPKKPVHGFIKGRGVMSNAQQHAKRPFIVNLDLQAFFETITSNRILGVLKRIGIKSDVASCIAKLTTCQNTLPQGAPTSPILSNMISFQLDRFLMNFAKHHNMRYTRYADDITFSSFRPLTACFESEIPTFGRIDIDSLSTHLRELINLSGFTINPEKTWYSGPKSTREVTGLIVNEFPNLRRTYIRNIRAALYEIEKSGFEVAQNNYSRNQNSEVDIARNLYGRLEWLAQVRGRNFSAYRTLANRFNNLFPTKKLRVDNSADEIIKSAVWVIEWSIDNKEKLDVDLEQGTAIFVKGIGLVTANHVINELPKGSEAKLYRPSHPNEYTVRPSNVRCAHRDLVVLNHELPKDAYCELEIAPTPGAARDYIVALGFPSHAVGDQLSESEGTILTTSRKHGVKFISVSALIEQGMSGGPIIDRQNQLLGIIHRGGRTEPKQLAIDASELLALVTEQKSR